MSLKNCDCAVANAKHIEGCPFRIGNNQICGETQTLEIIKEFRRLYEAKMTEIQSGGDYETVLEAKVNLQQNWIKDLTEQNEMLVRAVEEMEVEAADRVAMLEEKLCKSAQQGAEVMQKYRDFNISINLDETFQNLVYLQSDMRNLLEFIKRARDEGTWSIDGLHFYNVTCEDLFGSPNSSQEIGDRKVEKQLKVSAKLSQKNKISKETIETEAIAVKLKEKEQELNILRRSMLDMRNALTIEVAEKHDAILNLRRDVQELEEKHRQANKQTQFKDDIIKEMRKEIKQLKTQLGDVESGCNKLGTTTIKHFRKSLENIQAELDKSLIKIKEELLNSTHISREASTDGDDLRQRLLELEEENRNLKKQIASCRRESDVLNKQANATNEKLAASKKQYEHDRRQSLSVIESLKQEIAEKRVSIIESGMQSEVDNQTDSLQRELEHLRNEYGKSQDQIYTLNAQIAAAKGEVDTVKNQAHAMNEQFVVTTQQYEQDRRLSLNLIETLQRENADKKVPLAEIGIQGDIEKQNREIERAKHNQEIMNLKQTIAELEKALRNSQMCSENLQRTVDLYQNSVNVLEASEQRSRIEMAQLHQTIINLQEALVTSKHQLDELQQKAASEIYTYIQNMNDLRNILFSIENQHSLYYKELYHLNELVEHLRDRNLDLSVENFGYIQDVAMLETRLLKYQHICKSSEDCQLNDELMMLRVECKAQLKTNGILKQQLCDLTCACENMQSMEAESKELQKMLQKVNGDLHQQADLTKQELLRESQLNDMKAERIDELQDIVGAKTMELDQCSGECCKLRQQLNFTLAQNQDLKAELLQLKNQILNYRESSNINDERSEYCQKEIENCKGNIAELSNRYMSTKEQLQQKIEMCSKLEGELCKQNNNCACLKQQLEHNTTHYEIDKADLKNTINNLNEKLGKTENNYQILHENFRRSQNEIMELTELQTRLQHGKERQEKDFTETIHKLECEEVRLGACVCQLQEECVILKSEVMNKERQLQLSQEENVNLKNEVNKLLQRYNKLKSEHEELHNTLDEVQAGLSRTEYHSHVTKEQFNQCLCSIQNDHMEKEKCLEFQNRELQTELEELQAAYANMEINYRKLDQSVITLEMKLLDNNMCREEICAESRNVISNVRAWLQNQTTINEELTQKLRDDEILIDSLKQQVMLSQFHTKTTAKGKKCCCKIRQRGGGLCGDRSLKYIATKSQPDLWSPGSQGSGTVSPNSIVSNTQEWYTYEEFEDEYTEDDSLLSNCLKRVESINQELQKSNQFWRNKMMDHDYVVTKDH